MRHAQASNPRTGRFCYQTGHHEIHAHRKLFRIFQDCEKTLAPEIADLFEREANNFARFALFQAILGEAPPPIEWLDDAAIAQRLRALREDHSAWRIPRETGQFSLAGAQPKTALLFDNNRWGVPSGRVPTTHILKPPTGEFDGHAENEHFCLELGRALGLPVVDSRIMRFQDEVAIVVERYDRVRTAAGLRRVHQEDMCQALAITPPQNSWKRFFEPQWLSAPRPE